jgi:hypothetical protein
MTEDRARQRLETLRRRWKAEGFAYCLLLALAVSVLLAGLLPVWPGWPVWIGLLALPLSFTAALFIFPYWRLTLTDIVSYLNGRLPELEESCGLLLVSADELGLLEQLQVSRTASQLLTSKLPHPMRRRLLAGLFLVVFAVAVSLVLGWNGRQKVVAGQRATVNNAVAKAPVALPAGVRSVRIDITPPAYTGRPARQLSTFAFQAEEGSLVSWELETSAAADTVEFIVNDSVVTPLRPVNAEKTRWRWSGTVMHPGYYQVKTNGLLSELYPMEVIRDEPPVLTILTPKAYTIIDPGVSPKIPLSIRLRDDYGISESSIMATVSSGKGEAVKFKEQELKWDRDFSGREKTYELSRILDLGALGLKPGDELYFYCRATDNHHQQSRSDTYIIVLTDTAQLMSLEGLAMNSDVKPEYFRSERQIIIETEQLLKEKDTLAAQTFNNRSNDLGFDQKLLRLRYGKFLGEEAEEGGAADVKAADFGDANKILDAYTDKHDNAEDATFFEPAVKQQLKATLSEMWQAELRLRTYKPQEALPYAYKALRLLKDLQQQSRAFVAHTGVHVTPLNPARRLTGELTAIKTPVQRTVPVSGLPEEDVLRMTLSLLDVMRTQRRLIENGSGVLMERAATRLGHEATVRPGEFLTAYQAMRRIIDGENAGLEEDVHKAQHAILRLLPVTAAKPALRKGAPDEGLSRLYFRHLNDPAQK